MTLQHDSGTPITSGLLGPIGIGTNPAALIEPQLLPDVANHRSLVVIDTSVAEFEMLTAGIENADVVVLDASHDGVGQITELLTQYQDLASLQIISHGDAGQLNLGSGVLNADTITRYADELTQWQSALNDEADILLYGCNVAAGAAGQAFVTQLHQLTGADIAASTDLTGTAALGGDWQLEYTQGQIETELAVEASVLETYGATLVTPIRYEVEDWSLKDFKTESWNFASNQQTVRLTANSGTATTTFNEVDGLYEVKIGYFDENDGEADATLTVGSQSFSWQFDKAFPGTVPTDKNDTFVEWQPPIELKQGDLIELVANKNLEEYARIDYVEFTLIEEPGTLSFANATYQVDEGTNELLVTVERTGGNTGEVSADITVTGGDAQTGPLIGDVDLTFPTTVTLADGVMQQTLVIPIVDDTLDEPTETLQLSLTSPTNGATLGSQNSTVISILDNDDPAPPVGPTIRSEVEDWTLTNFEREAQSLASNQETIRITAADGSATTNFTGVEGRYTIKVGFFDEVDGIVDARFEINGQLLKTWQFDSQIGGSVPTAQNFREITLETNVLLRPNDVLTIFADQDVEEYARIDYVEFVPAGTTPTPGTLAFADATYQVNEGSGELVVTVERTGGSAGEVSADITVTGGDAQTGTASDDVNLAFPITVTLADGVLQQTFTLPIVNDSVDETTETLQLSLSSPTNGATLGGVSSTTISIVDNDPALSGGGAIRSEVEDWTLNNFQREARIFASNQETIRITADSGFVETAFNGPSGEYNIDVGFFDENDGEVEARFEINGQLLKAWEFNEPGAVGDDVPRAENFRTVNLGTNVTLNFGDVLKIVAEQDIEEYARIDYIDFTPVTTAGSLSANLVNDTGASDSDRITADATIVGNVGDVATLSTLAVQIGTATIDITSLVQPDGSFTLTPQALSEQFGYFLSDGAQILTIISTDASDNTSTVPISLTLDRAVADLSLTTPIGGGDHSPYVHLLGDAPEAGTLTISVDGGSATDITLGAGEFDQLLQAQPLAAGARQLALSFTDVAGNTTQTTVDFDVTTTNFQIGGSGTQGWVARSNETIVLGESDSYVVEATQLIELGQSEGTRTLRFAVDAAFDLSDIASSSTDQLAVYLVDPNNLSQTLLDGGQPGTPVFTLAGDQAEFVAGQVRFDGQFVEIDLSSLSSLTEGLLIFQLLNQDGDDGSRVIIGEISNLEDPTGINAPIFADNPTLAMAGGAIDLAPLTLSNDVAVRFSQVRFDEASGQYTATLQLHNTSETDLGRNIAVLFANLPSGITLESPSGTDTSGNGYLNLRNAIRPGGLTAGSFSDGLEIRFSNPNQLRMALQPQVWVGGPNQAPVFDTVAPITAVPGQKTTLTLSATDPDGDPITYSLQGTNLPNSKLDGNGNLVFEPTPNQVGTYDFTVTATDGTTSVSQTVSLTVTPDPITTTRISGQVLDINGNPLANLPLELGRLQAVTDAQGYFTITLPDSSIPTEEINIKIPLGDPAFDPFLTGEQEINLRRTTFDGTTGTDAANPLRHPNLVTTFMDASMVYGSDATRANALRTLDGTGKLKVSTGDLLPLNSAAYFAGGPLANNNRSLNDPSELFAAGDVRANENIGLTSLHTVFMREHNRLAEDISTANPGLTGEEIYQQARKLVSAQIQHITYQEYLPLLLGQGTISTYSGYDNNVDPSISHLFSAAAFRLGHTQSFDEFLLIDGAGQTLPSVSLRESTFNPEVIQQNGIEAILRGLVAQSAEAVDLKVLDDLRNTLFGPPGSGGIDLAAVDIERGRDVGLPDYNQAREDFGLARVTSFAEITTDVTVQAALAAVYGTVDNIDVIVGGLAEDKAAGAMVGELFQTIMADQFARLRDGDRFWYENSQFSQADLTFIRGTQLADLIERNTTITGLSGNIFSSSLNPTGPAAGGSAGTSSTAEYAAIDGSNNNLTDPDLGTVGTHMRVDYTQEYGDGVRTPGGAERPNTREISNALFSQDTSVPDTSGATGILLAWSQFMGHDFTFSPAGAADTLKVYGDQYQDPNGGSFPFVAEKLDLMLGHEVYAGVNNVIDRPIYLPALDLASNSTVPVSGGELVSNATLGASVFVENNSLEDREGNPFSGALSITEVPTDLTPAALPEGLSPDLVVTIQPSDLVFTDPAELALPNGGGWAPGTEMDLWSINPNTGDFEIVGTGRVSDDGSLVETLEGGIRNSSWHFFAQRPQGFDIYQTDQSCNACPTVEDLSSTPDFSSQVDLQTGGVLETHNLVTYQSQGQNRGVQLVYDSLRADARPIVQVGFGEVDANALAPGFTERLRLIAELTIDIDGLQYTVPGYGGGLGLNGGEHFWQIPAQKGPVGGSLQADLRDVASGVYDFDLSAGIYINSNDVRFVGSSTTQSAQLIHVNTVDSAFGSGWGIAGVQQIIETASGALLLIDGNGTELLFEAPTSAGERYQSPPGDFSTFEKLPDGTFQRTTKNQTVYTFDRSNRLISVVDRNNNTTQHVYNAAGQLEKIIDPTNLETTFTYNSQGKVETITDPADRMTQFQYDAAGNLTQIIDPDTSERIFEYDAGHRMTGEIDQRGHREQAFYDAFGRATHAIQKDGSVVKVAPTQVQGLYQLEKTANPDGGAVAYSQDLSVATYADGNGHVSQTTVDAAGQPVTATDGNGPNQVVTRNDDNRVSRIVDARGFTTDYTYDEQGNLLRIVDQVPSEEATNSTVTSLSGIAFDGDNDTVDFGDTVGDFGTGDFTVEFWLNATSEESQFILGKRVFCGQHQFWEVDLGSDGRIGIEFYNTAASNYNIAGNTIVNDGEWHHVGITRAGNLTSIFVNGDLDASIDYGSVLNFENSASFMIGESVCAGIPGDRESYSNQIDEVRIWDYARSQEEINTGKNLSFSGTQSGLLGYWRFDEGTGTTVEDLSGNGITGTLQNGVSWIEDGAPIGAGIAITETVFFDDFEGNTRPEWSSTTTADEGIFTTFSGRFNSESQTLTLNTTPGETYTLEFDFYAIDSWDGSQVQSPYSGLEVGADSFIIQIEGETVFDETFSNIDEYPQTFRVADVSKTHLGFSSDWVDSIYRDIRVEFTAQDAQTQIQFTGSLKDYTVDQESWGIDNVEVVRNFVIGGTSERTFTYDETFNQLESITDERGNLTLFEINSETGNRDLMRRVVGEVDSAANGETDDVVTTYTYTSSGLIKTMTDALGRVTDYDYNSKGQVSQITFALGTVDQAQQQFEYDAAGNLAAIIDENGNRTEYDYDDRNRVIQIIEADPDGMGPLTSPVLGFGYDAAGNLTSFTDARDHETEYTYDEKHRLIEVLDAAGNRTQYAYDDASNLVSILDGNGHETRYEYDSRDRRTAMIDGEGYRTEFRYDLSNNLAAIIDPQGHQTAFSYDARDRLIAQTDAFGETTHYTYDATNNLIGVKNRRDHETTYAYDELNRLTQVTDALDGISAFGYDKVGNLTSTLDERTNPTNFQYDARNRLVRMTNALGDFTQYSYDGVGNQLSFTDEENRQTDYTYDALNRLVAIDAPLSRRTTFGYDANDNLTSVTDARTHTTHYTYDQLNRQVTRIDAEGETSSLTYDAVGNVTAVTDELNRMTQFRYDQRNLQTEVIDPLAQVTTSTYDEVGNLVAVTNDLGQATQYEYDRLYRLTKITDATTEDTLMTYDEVGNLTQLKDASDNVTTFTYDELNRLDTETITVEGTALTRDYDYDATSNLTGLTDRNGRERTFGYDVLNRQAQAQWLDAQGNAFHTIDYTYFKDSQLKTAGDAFSNYAYTYDLAGRLATVDNSGTAGVPNVVLSYGYDAVNNRTSVTDTIDGVAAGSEAFTYDKLNRVTRLTQSGTGVAEKRVDMTYDAASQMTGLTRYSDLTGQQPVTETTYDYDLAGRLTDLTHQQGATVIADYDFGYDRANRLTQLVTPDGTSDYTYNDRHELTSTDHSYQGDEAYNYDATGNRTDNTTGDHNRLLDDGTYTYQYDNEGNRTRRVETATGEVTEYRWDHRNRLTKIETKDSSGTVTHAVAYTYDVYDRRITKSIDADGDGAGVASEENFVYDGGHIALVFDENGNQIQRYFHGPQIDQILAEETATGDTHWALTDHQGSVRDVIDNSGTVLNHIVYDSFGQVTSETDPAFDFRFGYTGRERDEESGMLYYRARYYDPAVGTFVGEDPLGFAAGDSNLYRYVFNSPTNYTDPSGEVAVTSVVVGTIVVGALINLLVPPPPVQAPTDCEDYHDDEYFWPRIGVGLAIGAATTAAAAGARGVAGSLPRAIRPRGVPAVGPGSVVDDVLDDALRGGQLRTGNSPTYPPGTVGAARNPSGGPVEFDIPPGATREQIEQLQQFCQSCNEALDNGYISPSGRVQTKGSLRREASNAAARERRKAASQGTPYKGVAGHVPDTTWTGRPEPYSWADLDQVVNSSVGAQSRRYPIGYKPTEFRVND